MNSPIRASLVLATVVSSGCMMGGGMGSITAVSAAPGSGERIAVAEAQTEAIHVTLEFPPVIAGRECTLLISVSDVKDAPLPELFVSVVLREPNKETQVLAARAVESMPGVYQLVHRFASAGTHIATAEIRTDKRETSPIVTVSVQQDVRAAPTHGSRSPLRPVALAGGAAMVTMMMMMIVF